MAAQDGSTLTENDAKKFIESHMGRILWRRALVVGAAVGAIIISGLTVIGTEVREQAYDTAYKEAFKDAQKLLFDIIDKSYAKAAATVESLNEDMGRIRSTARRAADDAEASMTQARLLTTQMKENLDAITAARGAAVLDAAAARSWAEEIQRGTVLADIARQIAGNNSFQQAVTLRFSQEIVSLQQQLGRVERIVNSPFTDVGRPSTPRRNWQSSAVAEVGCPQGSFVVGISATYGGTCRNQCDTDGGPIQQITLTCQRLRSD